MLEIIHENDNLIKLSGRWDAAQADRAKAEFDKLNSTSTIDFQKLDYISSSGIGVLVTTLKRLDSQGHKLILTNLNQYVRNVLHLTGLESFFEIR